MKELKFTELNRFNQELGKKLECKPEVKIRLLANITVNQLVPALEYVLRGRELNARVSIGDYDNIIQESAQLENGTVPVIFWEPGNIKDSFVFELENYSDGEFQLFMEKMKAELQILFENTKNSSLVIFNSFSHLLFTAELIYKTKIEDFVVELNHFIEQHKPSNYLLIDIDKVIALLGAEQSADWRGFYSSKALYSLEFMKRYASFIAPVFYAVNSKTRKALILDCDNTLWKGIVGEDGKEGIHMSALSKYGIPYREVQLIAKSLAKKGIVLGLNSKNNAKDVDEVFSHRKDMTLKEDDLVIKKVNWIDKATNLQEIAAEINIGIDSLVFVDDSDFEVNLIKERLPMVEVIQVPGAIYQYPQTVFNKLNEFYCISYTSEDLKRVEMYKENMQREREKASFGNIEDYLSTLEIKIEMGLKPKEHLERLAQMTQKTNQFNLTTKRYSTTDMRSFYESADSDVICIDVFDKYGSSGVTGMVIVKYEESSAYIDSLLMSCRILGRNIEKVFLQKIIERIQQHGAKIITAKYVKTPKNAQVEEFYENNGFSITNEKDGIKSYSLELANYAPIEEFKYITTTWKIK